MRKNDDRAPRRTAAPPRSFYSDDETKVHGVNACLAVWRARPDAIVKVYITQARLAFFSDLVRWCVEKRRAYKVTTNEEMQKITASVHHEGICLIAKEAPEISFLKMLAAVRNLETCRLVYFDDVQNPHNVGNVLRSCAHFAVPYVLVAGRRMAGPLPASARRVSEGANERVRVVKLRQPESNLRELKEAGFEIIGTSSHAEKSLFKEQLPKRCVFVLGSESLGVSQSVGAVCDRRLAIPGSGLVESLNVASAAAVLLAEHARQRGSD